MKILVVGSGGREHAICWKLKQSPRLSQLYCAPGNAGTSRLGENVPIDSDDIGRLLEFAASRQIDLTVVGPEAPLVAGIVDQFEAAGLLITGPVSDGGPARGQQGFCQRLHAPAGYPDGGLPDLHGCRPGLRRICARGRYRFPLVVKADGSGGRARASLSVPDLASAEAAVDAIMRERQFGASGDRLVIEEFLEGEECSFMVFSDGRNLRPDGAVAGSQGRV